MQGPRIENWLVTVQVKKVYTWNKCRALLLQILIKNYLKYLLILLCTQLLNY